MDRSRYIAWMVAAAAGLLFASAVVARYGGQWQPATPPIEIARAPGLASAADFDGLTTVWIEAAGTVGGSPALAWQRQIDMPTQRADLSDLGVAGVGGSDLTWLDAGPRVFLDNVVFQALGTVYVFDIDHRVLRTLAVATGGQAENSVAIDGVTAMAAIWSGMNWDIRSYDLPSGQDSPVVTSSADDYAPAFNTEWLVWFSRPSGAEGPCEVRAERRGGGTPKALGPCAASGHGPAIHGARVAWYAPDDSDEERLVVRMYDLESDDAGVLDRFAEPDGPLGGLDLSARWVIRSAESSDPSPDAAPGELVGYDIDEIPHLYDLESSVTSFTVARAMSMAVAPAVDDSTVAWSEPVTFAGGEWRLMRLLLARGRLFLPHVRSDPVLAR